MSLLHAIDVTERGDLAQWMRENPDAAREAVSDISILKMAEALDVGGIATLGGLIRDEVKAYYEYQLEDRYGYDLADDIDEAALDRKDRARDVAKQYQEGW